MYSKRGGNRKNKTGKTIKKAMWKATRPEDKLQNQAIMSLQKQVKALKKAPEIKFFDNAVNDTVIGASTPYNYPWSQVAQGIDYTERIGDQLTPLHSSFKMILGCGYLQGDTGPPTFFPSITRVITFLYLEDQSLGAPDLSRLLNTATVDSNRNPLYLNSFKVLHDKCYVLDQNNPLRIIRMRKRLSRKMKFNDPTYSATTFNALYVYILSSDSFAYSGDTDFAPIISYDHRLTFTDD
nr:MAG: capsid protein [Cressdnaviricota sp.]